MAQGFQSGRVAAARPLSAGIRNVTIAADSLVGFTFEPGADVLIRFPGANENEDERRYSVWRSSAAGGTLDVCIVQHGLGPGSRWAAECTAGDAVEIARSRALPIALDHSAHAHILLGDETSVAAAEALIRALPADAAVLACFEIDSLERRWPASELVRPDTVDWVARSGRPGSALLARFARQKLPPVTATTAYVTGEAWLCATLHAHLVRERGFRPGAVRAMPYWKYRAG
jgi:NADPH-dependent ferric siderophore reductase